MAVTPVADDRSVGAEAQDIGEVAVDRVQAVSQDSVGLAGIGVLGRESIMKTIQRGRRRRAGPRVDVVHGAAGERLVLIM